MHKLIESYTDLNPKIAGTLGMVAGTANSLVWTDAIKGWAATATVLIGVPTAALMLVYWALKVRSEWKSSNKGAVA
jgi:hypothetical protein